MTGPVVAALLLIVSNVEGISAATCACGKVTVHVRSGPGTTHSTIGNIYPGFCYMFKGDESKASGYEWAHIDYDGKDGWVAENYVDLKTCPSSVASNPSSGAHTSTHTGTSTHAGCPRIISKSEWGARTPKAGQLHLHGAVKYAFIHHGASAACHTENSCAAMARAYQRDHIDSRGFNDVGYSFLIGEDGNAYEGRGWDIVGAHTKGYNSDGLGFCIMGNYMERLPDSKALDTVQRLIACGVAKGKIQSNYILRGHRDVGATACPGTKLYALIKTWPHY
ncbi:peptidoglycan recognition protein 1-like [Haliotis asinina]|uniref:peptidoglycan recognition protein 1-like n=1 Tax=Haliotis asinina TaxID=109174 RepID=UPI0035320361